MKRHIPDDADYLAWLESRRLPRLNAAWRLCLGPRCRGRRKFWSSHAGERICPACKASLSRLYSDFAGGDPRTATVSEDGMARADRIEFVRRLDAAFREIGRELPDLDLDVALRLTAIWAAKKYTHYFGDVETQKMLYLIAERSFAAAEEELAAPRH